MSGRESGSNSVLIGGSTGNDLERSVGQQFLDLCNGDTLGGHLLDHHADRVALVLVGKLLAVDDDVESTEVAAVAPGAISGGVLPANPYLVVGRFGKRKDLLDVEKHSFVQLVRDQPDTSDVHPFEAVEPKHGSGDLSAEVR